MIATHLTSAVPVARTSFEPRCALTSGRSDEVDRRWCRLDASAVFPAQSVRASVPAPDPNASQLSRLQMLLDLDRIEEVLTTARGERANALAAGSPFPLASCQFAIGAALEARGDIDAAVAEYRAGLELTEALGMSSPLSVYGALASIAVHRDDLDTAADLVAAGAAHDWCAASDRNRSPLFVRATSELFAGRGQEEDALDVLRHGLCPLGDATGAGRVLLFAPDVVRLAMTKGDLEFAWAMAEGADLAASRLGTATTRVVALRCRGIINRDLDALITATDAAVDSPRPLVRAGAHEQAGRALIAAGRVEKARGHLVTATEAYEQLGFVREVARLAAAARAVGIRRGQRGDRRRPTHGWDSLTATERRVADLVASGLSNPAIAERMFLSRRTVQTHVSHILTKTGLTSRVELATAIVSRQ